ncbi:hypothetical protein FHS42_007202 [Streptomyces zagrosensis]|uniref:Uncharacterized protein n=1 Tax=Streptomyces zagrosensis TaxID=1042984 RepID=A0A7W9QHG4_9ACTN|nr:hypothetical protein [Streptomyces zagrosensis]
MHFELHQIRSQERIWEANEYRLAQQAWDATSVRRSMPASTWRPTPRRLLAWFRGLTITLP